MTSNTRTRGHSHLWSDKSSLHLGALPNVEWRVAQRHGGAPQSGVVCCACTWRRSTEWSGVFGVHMGDVHDVRRCVPGTLGVYPWGARLRATWVRAVVGEYFGSTQVLSDPRASRALGGDCGWAAPPRRSCAAPSPPQPPPRTGLQPSDRSTASGHRVRGGSTRVALHGLASMELGGLTVFGFRPGDAGSGVR